MKLCLDCKWRDASTKWQTCVRPKTRYGFNLCETERLNRFKAFLIGLTDVCGVKGRYFERIDK